MSVIERAEQRLNEEERQHELGADNRYDLHYWAAYLDGARAQRKEDAAALQKQIPKPPLQACGHTPDRSMNYCPICGQRLDWTGHF